MEIKSTNGYTFVIRDIGNTCSWVKYCEKPVYDVHILWALLLQSWWKSRLIRAIISEWLPGSILGHLTQVRPSASKPCQIAHTITIELKVVNILLKSHALHCRGVFPYLDSVKAESHRASLHSWYWIWCSVSADTYQSSGTHQIIHSMDTLILFSSTMKKTQKDALQNKCVLCRVAINRAIIYNCKLIQIRACSF